MIYTADSGIRYQFGERVQKTAVWGAPVVLTLLVSGVLLLVRQPAANVTHGGNATPNHGTVTIRTARAQSTVPSGNTSPGQTPLRVAQTAAPYGQTAQSAQPQQSNNGPAVSSTAGPAAPQTSAPVAPAGGRGGGWAAPAYSQQSPTYPYGATTTTNTGGNNYPQYYQPATSAPPTGGNATALPSSSSGGSSSQPTQPSIQSVLPITVTTPPISAQAGGKPLLSSSGNSLSVN